MGGTENLPVGPGVLGFLAVFVLAVALWFLMRNMNSRMRRMAYRERDRLAEERRAQQTLSADGDEPGQTPDDQGQSDVGRRPSDGA